MSKAVLISIQPKWCELIASGKKTIEVRKTRPKIDTPFKCYIYCTKHFCRNGDGYFQGKYCGRVIGEFVCDGIVSHCEMANADIAESQGKVRREDLLKYANGKELYGWHISDLVIYDKPAELGEFVKCPYQFDCCACDYWDSTYLSCSKPIRPPQSWCYVEEKL